eukprot:TRINITY_DN15623_c0_g2_i1.p2 TRINITY_DN15623_c0_g2~~TRINITY_DN15623_c0_g2_i1.p2  ORF type:complete len:103 (-),score=20.20 TRINITY_DN15623_c0_g2_i1:224-532(-)
MVAAVAVAVAVVAAATQQQQQQQQRRDSKQRFLDEKKATVLYLRRIVVAFKVLVLPATATVQKRTTSVCISVLKAMCRILKTISLIAQGSSIAYTCVGTHHV